MVRPKKAATKRPRTQCPRKCRELRERPISRSISLSLNQALFNRPYFIDLFLGYRLIFDRFLCKPVSIKWESMKVGLELPLFISSILFAHTYDSTDYKRVEIMYHGWRRI